MNAKELLRFLSRRPFVPFVIHVVDGREFVVSHPDIAILGPEERTVHVLNADKLIEALNLFLIVSLQPLAEKKSKSGK